jgi:hypothetical protein
LKAATFALRVLALLALPPMAGAQVAPSPAEIRGLPRLARRRARAATSRRSNGWSLREAPFSTAATARAAPRFMSPPSGARVTRCVLCCAPAPTGRARHDRYDAVTIAAVADDEATLRRLLALGASARQVTSRYDGTALIAARHLGHDGVVRRLIAAGAPLDHVNNLHWTALIEAIVLGDGGPRHQATARARCSAPAPAPRSPSVPGGRRCSSRATAAIARWCGCSRPPARASAARRARATLGR